MGEAYTYESPFELSIVPITRPEPKPDCEIDLMHHEFGNCYYKPYVGPYTLDEKCKGKTIKKVILTWKGYCKGTQYDRVAAAWIDGIEILRTSTAEPTQIGLGWEFSVDITRYRSLFYKDRTLTVSLNNIVNDQYTGSFIIDIKLEIYLEHTPNISNQEPIYQRPADDFIGISQFGQNSEPWYTIENNKSIKFKLPQISSRTQRAILEVFITGHGKEEFHQFNIPDDPRKEGEENTRGPLRELHVSVNGIEAGVGWPFPVIFTGGVCPALWRPISGIGSFSADPVRFEFSQFIGDFIKNPNSEIELLVSPSIPFWNITGNLHLWYSDDEIEINGGLLSSNSLKFPINPQVETNFDNSVVNFKTKANRAYSQKGYIDREDGRIQVETSRKLTFDHDLQYFNDTNKQIYDFTANVITETRFLHFPPEVKPDDENQAGVRELHKESFNSKWRFFGQTEYQPCQPYGSLIDATMTAEVTHKDHVGDQLTRELSVNQHNTGVFGRIPNMPFVVDGTSSGTVRYFNKSGSEEERFSRSVETEHGWTVQDSNNTSC